MPGASEINVGPGVSGPGGIVLGGFLRPMIIALDRGDLAKLPFSDDVDKDSRLLMRPNVREGKSSLAPFLTSCAATMAGWPGSLMRSRFPTATRTRPITVSTAT
jgi:uncharacterized membrane protein (UPF0182 family)